MPILPTMYPNKNGTFPREIVPYYKSNLAMETIQTHQLRVLDWRENSLDMNPIEIL